MFALSIEITRIIRNFKSLNNFLLQMLISVFFVKHNVSKLREYTLLLLFSTIEPLITYLFI